MKRVPLAFVSSLVLLVILAVPAWAWQFAVVDSNNLDSPTTSLAISGSDKVWVAWQQAGGDDLWWAKWTGSSWTKTQIAGIGTFRGCYERPQDGYDFGPAAGFKANGTARVASMCIAIGGSGAPINWTRKVNGAWTTTVVAYGPVSEGVADTGTNVDLAFDPDNDDPSIAFGDEGTASVSWVHYSPSTGWLNEIVYHGLGGGGVDGPVVSIAFDPTTGDPAIAWNSSEELGSLSFLEYSSGTSSWTNISLSIGDCFGVPSLAYAPDGTPWIAFRQGNDTAGSLAVAKRVSGVWSISGVDSGSSTTGDSPSIAFKGSNPRIAYYDVTNGDLRWAAFTGTSWTLSKLDSTNNVGAYPSAAFSAALQPYISYWDLTKQDVRWARPS